MRNWWWSKEKGDTPPPPKTAVVSSEGVEAKVSFWESSKRLILLFVGCAVLMVLARTYAVHSKAEAEKQKQFKAEQTSEFQIGAETDRSTLMKIYGDQAGKSSPTGTPPQALPQAPPVQSQFTDAQLHALSSGAPLPPGTDASHPNPALPTGTAPSTTTQTDNNQGGTVAEKPVRVALIINHRSQGATAEETPLAPPIAPPQQPAGPIASYAPFPSPGVGAPTGFEAPLLPHTEANGNPIVDRNKQNPEDAQHDLHAATGPHYRIREGMVIPCTEELRAVSNYASHLNCFVAIDVYSPDGQHLLIPQGSLAIGHAAAISSVQQRRLFVVWEKIIMPDGYTLDYGNAPGLDQSGATGVTGKMDNHFLEVFGVGIGVAALSAGGQVGNFSSSALSVGSQLRSGITNGAADTGAQILNRYLPLPTMTYKEGSQGNIYAAFNWWTPEYKAHTMKAGL